MAVSGARCARTNPRGHDGSVENPQIDAASSAQSPDIWGVSLLVSRVFHRARQDCNQMTLRLWRPAGFALRGRSVAGFCTANVLLRVRVTMVTVHDRHGCRAR